ncbi:MAG: hypothetical protein KDB90_17270 [Planctomycetes bacterium]|nr:hypothetical protein [Planctomycetota bacterium]
MQTRLKSWLIGTGIAAAVAPALVLALLALFRSPQPEAPQPEYQPRPAVPDAPPAPLVAGRAELPGKPAPPAQDSPEAFQLPPGHVFGAHVMLGEFRVVAINRYWADTGAHVLTLEQAVDRQLCTITETGHRESVVAEVKGNVPVLVLTGDLLFGGRQDRLVAHSMLLPPGTTILPVFCAETTRWTSAEGDFSGTFRRGPQVDLNVKAAVYQMGTQDAVWHAIEQVTAGMLAPDPERTGAYRHALDTKAAGKIEAMLAPARQIACVFTVGFAVYRDNKLVAADIFDSTDLLERVSEKLLRSYAMTAVFGSVANWAIEKPLHTPSPTRPPQPPRPDYKTPNDYAPPPSPLGTVKEDGTRRFECRRAVDTVPVHIGIFRK